MIIEIKGPLIPDRRLPQPEIFKLQEQKTETEWYEFSVNELHRGVRDFYESPQMPIHKANNHLVSGKKDKDIAISAYLRLGFFIPEILPAEYEAAAYDDEYIIAIPPEGWYKRVLDPTGICAIMDKNNAIRIKVFVVNSFYERYANYLIVPRYQAEIIATPYGDKIRIYGGVIDVATEKLIHTTEKHRDISTDDYINESNETGFTPNMIRKNTEAYIKGHLYQWLRENYPEWQNPLSYWE